jgi:hypothetical protein
MDGPSLIFIVMPIVIPLALAAMVGLPYAATRRTARAASRAQHPDERQASVADPDPGPRPGHS